MTRRGLALTVSAVLVALLVGCASPETAMQIKLLAPAGSYPAQSLVQVLTAAPDKNYVKIASLSMTGAPGAPAVQIIDALQKKAGDLGANALIVQQHAQAASSQLQFNPVGGQYQTQPGLVVIRIDALAIRLQDKSADSGAPILPR